jgi:hypothetical protein
LGCVGLPAVPSSSEQTSSCRRAQSGLAGESRVRVCLHATRWLH